MLYTDLTKKALNICYEAHENQVDKGDVPYVFHPVHLAEQLSEEYAVCVALLHDVLEDSEYTLKDIEDAGFPVAVVDAVACITRAKGQDYMEYIKQVKTNKLATQVKLLDLVHNSDVSRLEKVDEHARKRLEKYEAAKKELMRK